VVIRGAFIIPTFSADYKNTGDGVIGVNDSDMSWIFIKKYLKSLY